MTIIRQIAQKIRHLPGLERADGLWALLREPYHRLLNANGHGVEILVGGAAPVRIPAEYAGVCWEEFEPESVAVFFDWVRRHPGGTVLDIGSSLGIYSAIALFADDSVNVVAFDSDLASLAATRRLSRHACSDRLQLVHGLLAEQGTDKALLAAAVAATEAELKGSGLDGKMGSTRFVCLNGEQTMSIPRRRLDDLFADRLFTDGLFKDDLGTSACLIKCDIEGAELLALSGGEKLLRRHHPDLLLSVHPPALPQFGHDTARVRSFLTDLHYDIRHLASDHEEHWWCQFKNPN